MKNPVLFSQHYYYTINKRKLKAFSDDFYYIFSKKLFITFRHNAQNQQKNWLNLSFGHLGKFAVLLLWEISVLEIFITGITAAEHSAGKIFAALFGKIPPVCFIKTAEAAHISAARAESVHI